MMISPEIPISGMGLA